MYSATLMPVGWGHHLDDDGVVSMQRGVRTGSFRATKLLPTVPAYDQFERINFPHSLNRGTAASANQALGSQ